jgi:hemolysin III
MSEEKIYSKGEERLNVISHAIGFACALAVSVLFVGEVIAKGGDGWSLASMLLYAVGMLSSYAFSTAYHATRVGTSARRLLRKFDHAAIYWYIAGCYSPITLIAMRDTGYWGWGIFAFCWLCAIVGTLLCLRKQKKQNILETVCYVLMGLTILVAMKQFYNAVPLSAFLWVVGEGVAYIAGAVLYSIHKVKYVHAIFHFFVMLGTLCHMIAVWQVLQSM